MTRDPRKMLERVLTGDGDRRSRLHDYDGNLVDPASLLSLPSAVLSTAALKITGHLAERPWISYRAARAIARLLPSQARVLEFGSGMSTLWFARRAARVLSVETNPEWFARVGDMLTARHLDNVDRALVDDCEVGRVAASPRSFDFALVDCWLNRDDAMRLALDAVRPGGYVYLDNSDCRTDAHREASRLLRERAAHVRRFVDFYPGSITVSAGLLGHIPER